MPSVKKCPNCGSMNVGDLANCLQCQTPLVAARTQPVAPAPRAVAPPAPAPAASSACPYCRAAVPAGNSFCSACGRQVTGAPIAPAAPAPAPAWQPPPAPAAYAPAAPAYGYPQQFANNSGSGTGPVPPEVPGWNWGAFFFSWLWGVSNGVWVSLLIAMLGLIGSIWLGAKGSEMAWQKRRFESVEQFKGTQRAWATWGWVLFVINLIVSIIAALIMAAMVASGELDLGDFQ